MHSIRHRIHQEIFYIFCLLLAALIPVFPRLLPAIIFFMVVNWLIQGTYFRTIPLFFKERWRIWTLALASLYLLYLLGMLYSTDYEYGWKDLEIKLSLVVFPVVFATSDMTIFTRPRFRLLLQVFIAGCLAGSLLLLCHTWIFNERRGVADAYYYISLSWYFHPTYLAMYYNFALVILLFYFSRGFSGSPPHAKMILILTALALEALIFLLSSKTGLIMILISEALFIILLIRERTRVKHVMLILAGMILVFITFSRIFPFAFTRINRADATITEHRSIMANPNDGTLARMEIWKISLNLIRQNFLTGVGTGDVKDVLMEAYKSHNLYPVLKKKLNAHNQYLQTFLTLGVLGFTLLLAVLIFPLIRSVKGKDYLYAMFILVFGVNILFESMLELQAGVVFYAFFNAFLFAKEKATLPDDLSGSE